MTLLERLRLDARLDRFALSRKAGVPVRTIRELESGRVRTPKLETLAPLADALGVAVSELAIDFRSGPVAPTGEAA